jgi:FlaA1/EpsC-like NDP-sugar epimerase
VKKLSSVSFWLIISINNALIFLGVSLRVGLYRASLRYGASTSLRLPLQSLTRFAIRTFMMLCEIIAFYSDKIGKTEH